ncbi:MAG: glycine cleavage system protein GcvH [Planctomycetaceae bacterium]
MDRAQLKFAKTHEWAAIENGVATIGISDFAVKLLSDLVFIDLPAKGKKVRAGDTLGEVESVKAVSDIYAPLSGEVIEVNGDLADHLERLTTDAFGSGWMVKLKLAEPAEAANLLDAAAYQAHCAAEQH